MRNLILASILCCAGCHIGVANSCIDGVRDGSESDVDCGGASCSRCGDGRVCRVPSDCASGSCVGNICGSVNPCTDFVRDNDETDVDCGGSVCSPCGDGRVCAVAQDCASQMCSTTMHCQEGAFTAPHLMYAIKGGAGLLIVPGSQAGYGITAAVGGSSFCLVWTGDGNVTNQYHEFFGSVYTDGLITQVIGGCPGSNTINPPQYVSPSYQVANGTRVDFDAANVNDLQGFTVVVSGGAQGNGEPVYFDLFIDGVHNPQAIIFTDATTSPPAASFPTDVPFGAYTG